MSFVNIAPFGGYITGDQITETQINYWCAAIADAIDGANGGTYTLAAPLIINGDDLQLGENLSVQGNTTLGSSLADTLTVNATTTFATTVGFSTDVIVTGALNANGAAALNGSVALGNAAADAITITGTPTLATPLGFSGTGRVLETGTVITASASVDTSAFRNILLGTSSAGQTITLTATGATNGDWFILSNASGNSWNIAGIVTNTIADLSVIKIVRIGGVWTIVHRILS